VLPAGWATAGSNASATAVPLPFAQLFSRAPPPPDAPFMPNASAFPLDGFDISFTQLLFQDMLGITPVYLPSAFLSLI
jgi:hypothetical protein